MTRAICKVCGKRKVTSKMVEINLPNNIHSYYHVCKGQCTITEKQKLNRAIDRIVRALSKL